MKSLIEKDKRHTNKPCTMDMWREYYRNYCKYNNKTLARKYKKSINTIYAWNSELNRIIRNKYNWEYIIGRLSDEKN